jgi:hypothetical protein
LVIGFIRNVTTNNCYRTLSYTSKRHCNYSTHKAFSVFTIRCLVAVSNSGSSSSSGFPNCPRPQLPASYFSQPQLSTQLKVKVTLQLAVYRQSVRLSAKPLEDHHQISFQRNHCGHSPYVTCSLTRRWGCFFFDFNFLIYTLTLPKSKSKLCYDRRPVGQSVLVLSTHIGLTTRCLLLSDSCGFDDVRRSL